MQGLRDGHLVRQLLVDASQKGSGSPHLPLAAHARFPGVEPKLDVKAMSPLHDETSHYHTLPDPVTRHAVGGTLKCVGWKN